MGKGLEVVQKPCGRGRGENKVLRKVYELLEKELCAGYVSKGL